MKILFTAFKGIYNTSFQLVDQTRTDYVLLTNSFQGLEKDISSISNDYSIVYMFGVDKTLVDKVRIETCANNNNETIRKKIYLQSYIRQWEGQGGKVPWDPVHIQAVPTPSVCGERSRETPFPDVVPCSGS